MFNKNGIIRIAVKGNRYVLYDIFYNEIKPEEFPAEWRAGKNDRRFQLVRKRTIVGESNG